MLVKRFTQLLLVLVFLGFQSTLEAQNNTDTLISNTDTAGLIGKASYYADKFNGRRTASGEIFKQSLMTCATKNIPMGTWIRVTNLSNKRSVIVKVNDRLPASSKRLVDLTKTAATQLGFVRSGITTVRVEILGKKKPA
jgi:rare lipoprotein A